MKGDQNVKSNPIERCERCGQLAFQHVEPDYLCPEPKLYSKQEVVELIDQALRTAYTFGDAMSDACSITEYAEPNYRKAFDEWIEKHLK